MGFRLFRRIKILPGVTLNLSKSGASVSVGMRGSHVTVNQKGVRKTVGLPGTGVFYTEYEKHGGNGVTKNAVKPNTVKAPTGGNSMVIIFLLAIIGLSAAHVFGISMVWPVLIIVAVIYFSRNKGVANEISNTSDRYQGIDKRFFTASGEAKYSEAEGALIGESAQALTLLVSTTLTIANESTVYDVRVKNTKIAKDTIATLQKYVSTYPGIKLTSFNEVMHSVELIEQETRAMGQL